MRDSFKTIKSASFGKYFSLPALSISFPSISRLPISLRIILESLLRNGDGIAVTDEDIAFLANWNPQNSNVRDIPFIVSRVILQDFTGVPLLVDLAVLRDAIKLKGKDPRRIEPKVAVDLVIDHSVQVDKARSFEAFSFNQHLEMERNKERYRFLKWGKQAFNTFRVVPPATGIVHQVNLEYLASTVTEKDIEGETFLFPDTVVGTDSHTTMINGLGILGWGVGGIEAEAAMLGLPVSLQTPEVIGVHLVGHLKEGVTATDLTLAITETLRQEKVVGKFVEFFGEGVEKLSVADRATVANMAPEYGATTGFFPIDQRTLDYLTLTGRSDQGVKNVKDYFMAQEMFGVKKRGEIDFTKEIEVDLSKIKPSVSGPKRPQDRIDLPQVKSRFKELLMTPESVGGYGKEHEKIQPRICIHSGFCSILPHESGGTEQEVKRDISNWSEQEMVTNRPFNKVESNPGYGEMADCDVLLTHGSIVIAAITSCTNTSNPHVMLAAGLLAKKAVTLGLRINPMVKSSLAPGSRVVSDYLKKAGLQEYLDALGFQLVGYGCTTCIGNSGPLDERIEEAIRHHDLIAVSVLSGNRNFEARIHSAVKANFLMSPPLVVAFAIAGRIDIDLENEPLGYTSNGEKIFLKDIWPSDADIEKTLLSVIDASMFKNRYAHVFQGDSDWESIQSPMGSNYIWDENSTYIRCPPFLSEVEKGSGAIKTGESMRALCLFGDSVTTDHISPAGAIKAQSPAGTYLLSLGIKEEDFNSYGSRRGNHEVMMRGTFANVRLRNLMADGKEGGMTKLFPEGVLMSIFDASQVYAKRDIPLIIFAGKDYGMGSSRDWAAKGPFLLGVRAVVAISFERIHRSNLIGMGILPLEFIEGESLEGVKIRGDELFSIETDLNHITPQMEICLKVERSDLSLTRLKLKLRLDTPLEVEYYQCGGILPYMLQSALSS